MSAAALLESSVEGIPVRRGKVRDIYDFGDRLLFVASDRISAFDVIMPNGIPRKGEVLTQISHFWFDKYADLVPNHRVADGLPENLAHLAPRSMVVKKAEPLEIECIVRGYIAGSGWKEYQREGTVCGIQLPENLLESAELEQPLFTPSTKADEGHDENISFSQMIETVGEDDVERSLALTKAAGYEACFGAFRGSMTPGSTDLFAIPRHHFEPEWPAAHVKYFARGNME